MWAKIPPNLNYATKKPWPLTLSGAQLTLVAVWRYYCASWWWCACPVKWKAECHHDGWSSPGTCHSKTAVTYVIVVSGLILKGNKEHKKTLSNRYSQQMAIIDGHCFLKKSLFICALLPLVGQPYGLPIRRLFAHFSCQSNKVTKGLGYLRLNVANYVIILGQWGGEGHLR